MRKQAGDCTKKGRRDTPFLCVIIIIANYRQIFQCSGKIFEKLFEPVLGQFVLKLPRRMVKSRTVTCVTLQPQKNYLPVTAFSHRFHIRPVQYNHPAGMRQVPPAGQGAGKSPVMRGGIRPNVCTGSRGFWPVRFFFIRQSSNIDSLFISTGPGGPFRNGMGPPGCFGLYRGRFRFPFLSV